MRRVLFPAVIAAGAILPCTASAEIVKAPTGETSSLTVASSQAKTFKKNRLKFAATGAAKASGNKLTMPYSLSRWDFGTREGDVAYYTAKTGFTFKRGKRTAKVVNPRLVLDSPRSGYVSALIANERIKFFTVSGATAKAADVGNVQSITGYRLKLTQAGANYVNRALKKKALKRFSQFGTLDVRLIRPAGATGGSGGAGGGAGGGTGGGGGTGTPGAANPGGSGSISIPGQGDNPGGALSLNPGFVDLIPGGGLLDRLLPGNQLDLDGDGTPELTVLPLQSADVDLGSGANGTPTGTIKLAGGLVLNLPGLGTRVEVVNPEVVLGANAGLYGTVNGVRVKVGDIDTSTLDLNVLDGTVTIKDLDVTVGANGMLNTLLQPLLGSLLPANTPLLNLDLSFPDF